LTYTVADMFYHNTRFHFKLADQSPDNIAGGILSACGIVSTPAGSALRQEVCYLQHRLFDPQLYLARLDARVCGEKVVNLASYPWFSTSTMNTRVARTHGGVRQWQKGSGAPSPAALACHGGITREEILLAP
jgi:hypothetical protein